MFNNVAFTSITEFDHTIIEENAVAHFASTLCALVAEKAQHVLSVSVEKLSAAIARINSHTVHVCFLFSAFFVARFA